VSPYLLLLHGCLTGMFGQVTVTNQEATGPLPPAPCCVDRHQQAGWPRSIAWWAIPSDRCGYTMYRVGGDCPLRCVADPPRADEGTWGWDYVGRWFRRNVILGWWHERRPEVGESTYKTDGPNLNHGEGTLLQHQDH
jgi:hypothetical protein